MKLSDQGLIWGPVIIYAWRGQGRLQNLSGQSVFWPIFWPGPSEFKSEALLLEATCSVPLHFAVCYCCCISCYCCCYYFSFQAREESKVVFPPPAVKTEVTVIITDVNDEIPMFRSKSYLAEVNENAQASAPVTFLNSAVPEVFDHDQVIVD